MVTWFAALFYLPRLFVYHASANDLISLERFKVMESKLYYGIAWPGGVITAICGLMLIVSNPSYMSGKWLHWKLMLILITWIYHLMCGYYLKKFKTANKRSHVYFRVFNEIPVIMLVGIIALAVYRPM